MEVIVLNKCELQSVLKFHDVIECVRDVYRQKAQGNTVVWPLVEHHFHDVGAVMDIRSGGVFGKTNVHGLKMLNNFPSNSFKQLPPFTGILMVCDSTTGLPLGIMDASYITSMRTGAAGAIGAKEFSKNDARTLLIVGAGRQSIFQIAATLYLLPGIGKVYISDPLDNENACRLVESCKRIIEKDFGQGIGDVQFVPALDLEKAVGTSDIIITITPSRSPIIRKEWVNPGTHFSCIGADMVGKEELEPEILRDAKIFCDDIQQCLKVGEVEIPYKSGIIDKEEIVGEIGQVILSGGGGRTSEDDVTVFDATGLAILDLVTAKLAITIAKENGIGRVVEI